MIERRLKLLIVTYLWVALVEDTILFVMAGSLLTSGFGSSTLTLRPVLKLLSCAARLVSGLRSHLPTLSRFGAGEPPRLACRECWRALFRLVHRCVLYCCRTVVTTLGWILLLPPPFLNLLGVVIMLAGYRQAQRAF